MRRNKKSRILAVLLAVSLSGSSAVYAQAEEVNNPDTDIEICGEEHEMKEVQVVEPTCTESRICTLEVSELWLRGKT